MYGYKLCITARVAVRLRIRVRSRNRTRFCPHLVTGGVGCLQNEPSVHTVFECPYILASTIPLQGYSAPTICGGRDIGMLEQQIIIQKK